MPANRNSSARERARGVRRSRVTVCVDLDDDANVIRTIHRRYVPARGHLVLTAASATGVDDLIRSMLLALNVLWRLPAGLRPGGVRLDGEQRAIAEWEISWALTRVGIRSLWIIDADHANLFAWRWLRDLAERENLRLTLHTTAVPDNGQARALTGCRVRTLSPERLRSPTRRPARSSSRSPADTDKRSRG